MPIYEYKCTECDFRDTYIRAIAERDTPPLCRMCGAEPERVVSFTGTVWSPTAGGHR